jgi:hypothetical protein
MLADNFHKKSSGSDERTYMIHDVWPEPVEMFSSYEACSSTKVCPYYETDYNAKVENKHNEEEFHNQRAATFTRQAEVDKLLPYLKTIAYKIFNFIATRFSNRYL